jgi:regulator of sirC expression with transglutaminase-like and TPR domain
MSASRGDFARAYLALDRIISFGPTAAEALRERASLAVRLGSFEAARADYTRSLEIDRDSTDAIAARSRLAQLDSHPTSSRPLN